MIRRLAIALLAFWLVLLLLCSPRRSHFLRNSDHGFQLGQGSQVQFGKTPGVDTYNPYGPAVIYVSALSHWATGSLVGEVFVCSLGYAASLSLIFLLVARSSGLPVGLLASVGGFVVLARFYKWYMWLWPLLIVWALERWLRAPPDRRGGALVRLGLVVGATWLFRADFGSACAFWSTVVCFLVELRPRPGSCGGMRRGAIAVGLVVSGFALIVGSWFLFLALREGLSGCVYFLHSTFGGAMSVQTGMGGQYPRPNWMNLLSPTSVRAIAPAMMLATIAAGMWIGLRSELRGRGGARSRILLASAVVGLGTVHQALYRTDGHHILQAFAPTIVGSIVLADTILRRAFLRSTRRRHLVRLSAVLYLCMFGIAATGLPLWGRIQLRMPTPRPVPHFEELANPVDRTTRDSRMQPVLRILELTEPDESILIFPVAPQLYFFVQRRMSGKLHAYYTGMYSFSPWSDDNLAEIRADMPALVVVPSGFNEPHRHSEEIMRFEAYISAHDYLDQFLLQHYTEVLYDDGRTMLLGRPGSHGPARGTRPGPTGGGSQGG